MSSDPRDLPDLFGGLFGILRSPPVRGLPRLPLVGARGRAGASFDLIGYGLGLLPQHAAALPGLEGNKGR